MDRFPAQQTFDRSLAPAVGAAADGLAQGMVYTAVIQSAIVEGMVAVSVPALHLSQTFQAHIKPDSNCVQGETCLIEYDEFKTPWVITGSWSTSALVTSLPAGPIDGQVINYLADEANGVVWQLRYRAGSTSAHKWEFVGGSDIASYEAAHDPSGPQKPLAAFAWLGMEWTPAVTLPFAGDYDIFVETAIVATIGTTDVRVAPVAFPAVVPLTSFGELGFSVASVSIPSYAVVSGWHRCAGITAGTQASLAFSGSSSAASLTFYGRTIRARPIRVG